jgi:hypothetical protein
MDSSHKSTLVKWFCVTVWVFFSLIFPVTFSTKKNSSNFYSLVINEFSSNSKTFRRKSIQISEDIFWSFAPICAKCASQKQQSIWRFWDAPLIQVDICVCRVLNREAVAGRSVFLTMMVIVLKLFIFSTITEMFDFSSLISIKVG